MQGNLPTTTVFYCWPMLRFTKAAARWGDSNTFAKSLSGLSTEWTKFLSLCIFELCFSFCFVFQQTKKYILNLKALVNLGITCSETLTNFIVCKFNEILGSTNVKLSRLGHVELCKDCSTRIPCIHGFTTQSKIKGEKTNLGSGGQKQPVAKIHSVRRTLLMTTFSQYAATIVCKPTNLNIIREPCMSNILQPLLSHAVLHKTHFWIIYSGLV